MSDERCGYSVTDIDGNEEPCDLPATGHRWYQNVREHEDMLDVACQHHENDGGNQIASLTAEVARLTAVVQGVRELCDGWNELRKPNGRPMLSTANVVDRLRAVLAGGTDTPKGCTCPPDEFLTPSDCDLHGDSAPNQFRHSNGEETGIPENLDTPKGEGE